jgi:hypothetical protein
MFPIVTEYGRILEYWKQHNSDHWCLTIADNAYNKYVLNNNPVMPLTDINQVLTIQRDGNRAYAGVLNLGLYE